MQNTKQFKVSIGGKDLVIETGLLAQQAAGAVSVSYGDTTVFTAVTNPVRVPREVLRGRQVPGRLLQARGASHEQGNPHGPHVRPSDTSAVPRRVLQRRAGQLDAHPERRHARGGLPRRERVLGRAPHQRDPVHGPDRLRPHRPRGRRVGDQPHARPEGEERHRPPLRRHPRQVPHDGGLRRRGERRGLPRRPQARP